MAYRINQACWPNCAPCGGPTIGTITCVSRQGDGSLCGFTRFSDPNGGDVNQRLAWRIAGTGSCSFVEDSGLSQCVINDTVTPTADQTANASGSLTAGTAHQVRTGYSTGFDEPCSPASFTDEEDYSFAFLLENPRSTSDAPNAIAGVFFLAEPYVSGSGTLALTRGDYDTVDAALARGSVTTGANCKTTAGTIGSASAFDPSSPFSTVAITGTRSVVATIPITGLTMSADYVVTVKINRYTAGGGSYVDFIYETIEFTAGATDEDITYDVPVNTDYDYEIDTSYKDIAAA